MSKPDFSVKEAVEKRISVRTYENRPLEQELRNDIISYTSKIQNPLGPKIRIQFIEKGAKADGEKLGTYGIIKGAGLYLGVTVPDIEHAPEALGYELEQLVLYAASRGLGTCWLGGTFNRSAFASAMDIKENEIFPILSPIGYPASKLRVPEQLFRRTLKADCRLPWNELFFKDSFEHTLSKEEAEKYLFPLEMVRLAPSAVNKQPWRIVITGNDVHFFEKHSLGGENTGVDMQRIDVGIAVCHFHLAALKKNLAGHFERKQPDITIPSDMTYIASWIEG